MRCILMVMSVAVYKDDKLVRCFPNLIDVSMFVGATVDEIEVAVQDNKLINGYEVKYDH